MRPILFVDPKSCHTCERCQARTTCRVRAIVQLEPGELPFIEAQRCMACQACLPACPHGAISRRQELSEGWQSR